MTLSGCSSDSSPAEPTPSSGGPTPPPESDADGGEPTLPTTPDSELVAQVRDELSRARARVQANRRVHPSLAARLRTTERLHARHASKLGGLVPVEGTSATAEKRLATVLPRLGAAESGLERRLVRASVAAESGALALLLAAMAAGVAQERTRL